MSTSARRAAARTTPPSFLTQLRSLGEWSGAAVGDSYARAARAVLWRIEQIEDLNAERRYEARLKAATLERERRAASPERAPALPTTK